MQPNRCLLSTLRICYGRNIAAIQHSAPLPQSGDLQSIYITNMEKDCLPRPVATRQGSMILNWKRVDLDGIQGRNSLWWRWWETGTGCPQKLWVPHHWHFSRPGWTRLSATWSSERHPCPWQTGWTRCSLKVPSDPNHSVTLWFSFRPHAPRLKATPGH